MPLGNELKAAVQLGTATLKLQAMYTEHISDKQIGKLHPI